LKRDNGERVIWGGGFVMLAKRVLTSEKKVMITSKDKNKSFASVGLRANHGTGGMPLLLWGGGQKPPSGRPSGTVTRKRGKGRVLSYSILENGA